MPPTSLYIHIPWCIKKCPYCDFNSHKNIDILPESLYLEALLQDLFEDLKNFGSRKISSIFIGGGTPSLLSGEFYQQLLNKIFSILPHEANLEITLEANPGTVDINFFHEYRKAGINRLSLGIQSFNNHYLKILGRIHDNQAAYNAFEIARNSGFDNINIDIMHSLPQQTLKEAMLDLETAINLNPEHISWYQLTIEPNTVFYKNPPQLPTDDKIFAIEQQGFTLLEENKYNRYEISAFNKNNKPCKHNMNYWQYGDYYGIGAGAHSKLTLENGTVIRTEKKRMPKDYLQKDVLKYSNKKILNKADIIFEFMLNASRLQQRINFKLFEKTTYLAIHEIMPKLKEAENLGFLKLTDIFWELTPHGKNFTNDLQMLFLPKK